MTITDKHDDGQVQSTLIERIGIDATPEGVSEINSALRIDSISDTTIDIVDGNIISGSCTLEAIDDDEEDDYGISADYTLEIDDDGDFVSLEYSNCELN